MAIGLCDSESEASGGRLAHELCELHAVVGSDHFRKSGGQLPASRSANRQEES
ncbi:MAG TPA: hypothetical protein VLG72_01940 [Nitrospirota bacterium]|nr:hypothetical protein [Nitrospirota bacterium]